MFGGHGWRTKLSAALGVDRATLYRWLSAGFVSDRNALAIRHLEVEQMLRDAEAMTSEPKMPKVRI